AGERIGPVEVAHRRLHVAPADVLHQRLDIPAVGVGPAGKAAPQRVAAVVVGELSPASRKIRRSRRTRLLGWSGAAAIPPHWLTARNSGPSWRAAAATQVMVAATGHQRDSAGTL
ncbi:hypothetical protein NY99_24510, partial [Xanthomonas phaseoli pv. phaseoli]